jgi:5,10-methylenetetrahydromethanopterin reductase
MNDIAPLTGPGLLMAGHSAPSRLVELAQGAEAAGFSHVWLADERFYREVYSLLTLFAMNTRRVQLGTCVTDPYSRHPALTAMAIATLDELSGGRALLGIGTGISGFAEMGVERTRPILAMREAIELVRRLLTGEVVDYAGQTVRFSGGKLNFAPLRAQVPVAIASNGPQGQALAARIADIAIMEACALPSEAAAFVATIRAAATAAGRAADAVTCVARLNVCIAADPRSARDALRPRAARTLASKRLPFATHAESGIALPEDALAQVADVPYSAGVAPYAPLLPHMTDRIVDALAVGGTIEEVTAHIATLRRLGIGSVIIAPFATEGDTTDNVIRRFGEEVWPASTPA